MDLNEHELLKGKTIQEQIRTLVEMAFNAPVRDESYNVWLNAPNPLMRERSPQSWIDEGRGEEVRGILWSALTGEPS